MAIQLHTDFLFLGRGDEGFLENYSYEMEENAVRGGQIFMCLEILNNDAEAEDIGEAMFSNFKQTFYENLDQDPYERFEDAVKSVNKTLEGFREGKASRFIGNMNVLITAMVGEELFITQTGDAEAYLVRKRYLSIVSEGLGEGRSDTDTFVNIASGTLENGDTVLLASSRLIRYITKPELAKLFSTGKHEDVSDALVRLQETLITEILGRASVIGIAVTKAQEPEKEGMVIEDTEGEKKQGAMMKWFAGTNIIALKKWFAFGKKEGPKIPFAAKFSMRDIAKDKVLILLVLSIVILLSGIMWLRVKGSQAKEVAVQEQKLSQVQELLNDATTIGQFDRKKGSDLLASAEQKALEVLNSRYVRNKASKMLEAIQKQREILDQVQRVQPTVVADLSEKRESVNALGIAFLKDRLFAFESGFLFEILVDSVKDAVSISDSESVIFGSSFPDAEALAFMTRTGKVLEYRDSRIYFMDTADSLWKKGVDLKTYNDRLYILDPDRNQIWKYRRSRESYGTAENGNIDADLKNALTFAIDGSVYVLNKDGTLFHMYAGKKVDIPIEDSSFNPLKSPTRLYTDVDLGQIFVLEPAQNRVVVFDKDKRSGGPYPTALMYSSQYIIEGVGTLRDLYVSKDENKLYLLDKEKVYSVSLAQ